MAAGVSTATQPAPSSGGNAAGSGAGTAQTPPAPSAVVPFVRGSGKGRYKFFSKSGLVLTASPQDLGPIDVKAYDYMRSILVTVTATAAGTATAGTYSPDAPFNILTNLAVKQPNGQTMYQCSNGLHAAYIQKYGWNRGIGWENDPRSDPNFSLTTSTTAPSATFAIRIPFELDLRDALGALPNKDAAAPFTLELTLNALTNVFPVVTTSPTFTVEAWLEAYDQPPQNLNGQPVQTTPPNMNTLQRWTEQNITMSTGQFDARVRKLGNYVRLLLPVMKNSSNVRIGGLGSAATNWGDPVQIVLDEDVKDNFSMANWFRYIWELYGFGANIPVSAAAQASEILFDTAMGFDTGVYPINYATDSRSEDENVNFYLPTIESEDYLLRASWGSAVAKMVVLVCEVLPQGDIFS